MYIKNDKNLTLLFIQLYYSRFCSYLAHKCAFLFFFFKEKEILSSKVRLLSDEREESQTDFTDKLNRLNANRSDPDINRKVRLQSSDSPDVLTQQPFVILLLQLKFKIIFLF